MFGGDKNKKLLKAVEENDLEKVKKYLGKGADLETRNNVWDRSSFLLYYLMKVISRAIPRSATLLS